VYVDAKDEMPWSVIRHGQRRLWSDMAGGGVPLGIEELKQRGGVGDRS